MHSLLLLVKDVHTYLMQEVNNEETFFHPSSKTEVPPQVIVEKNCSEPEDFGSPDISLTIRKEKLSIEEMITPVKNVQIDSSPVVDSNDLKKSKDQPFHTTISLEGLPSIEKRDFTPLRASLKKAFPSLRHIEPLVPILILADSDELPQKLFLENVVKVISSMIAPASISFVNDADRKKKIKNPSLKLILAPIDGENKLLKIYPNWKLHQPIQPSSEGNFPLLLPLAAIENYIKDKNLKRSLWNALQKLDLKNTQQ